MVDSEGHHRGGAQGDHQREPSLDDLTHQRDVLDGLPRNDEPVTGRQGEDEEDHPDGGEQQHPSIAPEPDGADDRQHHDPDPEVPSPARAGPWYPPKRAMPAWSAPRPAVDHRLATVVPKRAVPPFAHTGPDRWAGPCSRNQSG